MFKKVNLSGITLVMSASILSSQTVPSDDSDQLSRLRQEVSLLKQGQDEIHKQLLAVLDILKDRVPLLDGTVIDTTGSPSLGRRSAKVMIVEFTDFQCPFCSAYARGSFLRLIHDYVDDGTVRYIVRNFPLEKLHPLARKAAEASLCAAKQGDFWALHDQIFADQSNLKSVLENIRAIGADPAMFSNCMESGKYAATIAADLVDGNYLRVRATPTFFVGYADPGDPFRIRAVRSLVGNVPYDEFKNAISETLKVSQAAQERRGDNSLPAPRVLGIGAN